MRHVYTLRQSAGYWRVICGLLLLLGSHLPAFAQQGIRYAVRLLPDGVTYQVSLSSTTTLTGAQQITNSGQVTIVGFAGRLTITNVQSVNGQWSNNTTVLAPSQSPGYDYFIFGLTPNTPFIPYSSTQETVLFTFRNSGACPGPLEIWNSNDPFRPNPPTQTINVGNDLTALGFRNGSTLYNAWLGNYNVGLANCAIPPTIAILSPVTGTTASPAVVVSGTATAGASVVLGENGTGLCATTATAGGSWSCAVTLSSGPHTVTAMAQNGNGNSPVASTSFTVVSPVVTVAVRVKAMLQGALIGASDGLMRDDLRTGGSLPLTTPYSASVSSRFTPVGGGGESMPASVTTVTGADAIVDWVLVELRSPTNVSLVVATRSALIQRDGDVVSASDGVSPVSFTSSSGSSFYVSVKHRNHLGVLTATALPLSTTGTVVDFTTMSAANTWNTVANGYDYNGYEMAVVTGKNALWAGDANHDGKVIYTGFGTDLATIFNEVLTAPGNLVNQLYNYNSALGYYFGDVNMNGRVNYQAIGNDPQLLFTNVLTNYLLNAARLYNFVFFVEQIPN